MKREVWIGLGIIGIAGLLIILVYMNYIYPFFAGQTIHHVSDVDEFYAKEVASTFTLPKAAVLIEAEERYPPAGALGWEVCVKFKLPNTRTPQEWVQWIAKASGFLDRHRKTDFLYEDDRSDLRKVEYNPENKIYIVEYIF